MRAQNLLLAMIIGAEGNACKNMTKKHDQKYMIKAVHNLKNVKIFTKKEIQFLRQFQSHFKSYFLQNSTNLNLLIDFFYQ